MLPYQAKHADKCTGKNYILADFPENFRLYEHVRTVKKTAEGGKVQATTKTHAGGGNDRQDAYLYGHPLGRKKRYRSPADFWPHLLWLATDPAADYDNCTCKTCCPQEVQARPAPATVDEARPTLNRGQSGQPRASSVGTNTTSISTPASTVTPTLGARNPAPAPDPLRRTSTGGPQESALPIPQRSVSNAPNPVATPQPALPTSQHMDLRSPPKPRVLDQQIDLQSEGFIFRPGEMVWYNRGNAWGLAVISRRWKLPNDPTKSFFRLQPLSWPGQQLPSETRGTTDLRPWLAWSVPPFTNSGLNNLAGLSWDTANWQAIQQGQFGGGEIGVDGSILAAKAIDASYTPVSLESRTEPSPGVSEIRWNGLFLGAERLWVGDTVRLKTPNPAEHRLLVIHQIVERIHTSAFNGQTWKRLEIIGDVFLYDQIRYTNGRVPTPDAIVKPGITTRMAEDMRRRNAHTVSTRGTAMYWKPVPDQQNISFETKDIKGRWYESMKILPLLKGPPDFENLLNMGDIPEAGSMMNAKGDCNQNAVPDVRKPERKDALGKSVNTEFAVVPGIDPPALPSQQQRQTPPNLQHLHQAQHPQPLQHQHNITTSASGAADPTFEFMDMDGMENGFGAGGTGNNNNNFY